jgi:hypothetical protein
MIKTVDQDSHPRIADFINNIDPSRTYAVLANGAKSPLYPLTDPRQFGILQSGPGCGDECNSRGAPGRGLSCF